MTAFFSVDSHIVLVGEASQESKIPTLERLLGQVTSTEGHRYVVDPDGVAMLPHSSGTTGRSKAVMLT